MGFRIVGGEIVFHIAAATPAAKTALAGNRLGDWGRKWAGTLSLEPDESGESLRARAMEEKFGS